MTLLAPRCSDQKKGAGPPPRSKGEQGRQAGIGGGWGLQLTLEQQLRCHFSQPRRAAAERQILQGLPGELLQTDRVGQSGHGGLRVGPLSRRGAGQGPATA